MNLKDKKAEFEKHVDFLKEALRGLRTGRANASLVESLQVEAYGVMTALAHCATISVPDAKSILITPWDKALVKEIEKAITFANLGVNPINDGAGVRIVMPPMTEENRKSLLKILGQKIEHARIGIRGIRDGIREEIGKAVKAKELTEDDRYDLQKELDELTREFTSTVEKIGEDKEKEIMTI
ncbi:ribosome recycling factor [Candidatus Uhrbacteria bacterium]|nr:ribosome recycling factor [Candidatus Uhrbacteria bacterium]